MNNKIISLLCIYTQAMLSHLVMKVKAVQPVPFSLNESNWIQLGVNLSSCQRTNISAPFTAAVLTFSIMTAEQSYPLDVSDVRMADV